MADQASARAKVLDQEIAAGRRRGVLHGMPLALKDLFAVSGVPMTAGSQVMAKYVACVESHWATGPRLSMSPRSAGL